MDGLTRRDYWNYPNEALREALLNALIHRDYGFSGSIIINVNDCCMEFISIGGLLPGLTTADIRNGISQLRNKKLTEVFHRLNFIEAYGTGIRRIFTLYEGCATLPAIDVTPNSFKLTLPNMNTAKGEATLPNSAITPQMQILLDYLQAHGKSTDTDVQELLGIRRTRSFALLRKMSDAGLIKIVGRGANRRITL
jgi:ATP-dependent DNA helicase RecG